MRNAFKCPYNGTGRNNMNCFYFGCLHQINDTCPILKRERELDTQEENGKTNERY